MQNNLSYLKRADFSDVLNTVHQEIIQKMKRESKAKKAQQIQNVLMKIKSVIKNIDNQNNNSAVLDVVDQQVLELINNTFQEQMQVHSKLRSEKALFYRSHKTQHIKGVDDIFEEEIVYLLKAAAKMKGEDINVDLVLGGRNSANIKKVSDHISSKAIQMINNAIDIQVQDINKKAKMKQSNISARAGKVDIYAPSFNVTVNSNDIVSQLLKAFSGGTFSLKNYSSYSNDGDSKNLSDINIHLGNSNIYKGITGSLSEILSDPRAQRSVFYRGMQILSRQTKGSPTATEQEVFEHFAHLRFIYELRGSGLLDVNKQSQIADFIIWNDPNSEKIIVRSTADLVSRYITNYSNAFSPVSMSAARLFAIPVKDD